MSILYCSLFSYRALAIFIESIGAVLILAAALFAVLERNSITPGLAGLSVTFALQVSR